ncbi:MAG: hypothetical protein PHO66_02720, partial [Eubacteriales bacterium]|nr:hypothetical protein [Eubacteriales bacterium]
MPWGRFDPVNGTKPPDMKNLNDMLRYLFNKVQGGLTRKELSSSLQNVIDSKAEAAVLNELGETVGEHSSLIQQNAAQISLKVSQTTYDGEKPHVGSAPPEDPPTGRLWLDTSATPNLLKRWDGAAWVAAGAEALKTAGIDISADRVQVDGAAVEFNTQVLSINVKDPDDQDISRVSIDDNGVSAERVNADALYTGPVYVNDVLLGFVGPRASRLPPGTYDIYVRPDGNDNNEGGWWGAPKRTIAGALDVLPKHLD